MIYSLRCCDPCEITSQKFYTYVCTYVCASVCPALKSPPPLLSIFLRSSFYHTSSLFIAILRIVIEPIGSYATYDRRSLSLSFHYSIYLSIFLSLTCPSEWSLRECVDSMFEPRAFYQPWIKEGINYYDS